MALHVALTHRTEYTYDRLTGLAPQIVRLRPAPHCRTPILSYSLKRHGGGCAGMAAAFVDFARASPHPL